MTERVRDAASTTSVLNEIQSGDGLSLATAGRLFPGHRGGRSVDPSTVFRWVTKGLMVAGRTVKLEAVRVGARWLTSRGAVARFVATLTDAAAPDAVAPPSEGRTREAICRAAEQAVATLESLGA